MPEDVGEVLTHKVGPLPAWGWAVIVGVSGFLYFHYVHKSAPTPTSSATGVPGTTGVSNYGPPGGQQYGGADYAPTDSFLQGLATQLQTIQATLGTAQAGAPPNVGPSPGPRPAPSSPPLPAQTPGPFGNYLDLTTSGWGAPASAWINDLYGAYLGRPVESQSAMNTWLSVYHSQGPAAVFNGITQSPEAKSYASTHTVP